MDVCLITAATAAEFADPDEINSENVRQVASEPQLGLLSLAAVLEGKGHGVRIVDLNRVYLEYASDLNAHNFRDFAQIAAQAVACSHAAVYGFGSICSSYPLTIRIASALKGLLPEATVLLGGPQASVVDVETLQAFPCVDLVLRGEAEGSLPVLLNELERHRRLDSVPGLTFRDGARIYRNASSPVIQDLDLLPALAYHLFEGFDRLVKVPLEIGRGCPFACTFCSTNDFFRRRFRLKTPERVLAEMRNIAEAYSFRSFDLVHDMFTVDRRRVVEFCHAMIGSKEGFKWSCSARTDCVDEELLVLMSHSGCDGIFFGIEVGSSRMQQIIDKHLDLDQAERIVETAERLGIRTTVSLITGFPDETRDDLRGTLRVFMHAVRCPSSQPQLNLLAPLAATPIYAKYEHDLTLEDLCSDMSHQGKLQNQDDLLLIKRYPSIFPNFYLLPTPNIERDVLLELREFILIATQRFRWLLLAIYDTVPDFLAFFEDWRKHRLTVLASLRGFSLRHFYRSKDFALVFQSFVESDCGKRSSLVKLFLEWENALSESSLLSGDQMPPETEIVPPGLALMWDDVPLRQDNISVVRMTCDLQNIIGSMKARKIVAWERDPHFYVVNCLDDGRIYDISDWLFDFLSICDGKHSIHGIREKLWPTMTEVDAGGREYALIRLIERVYAEGFIKIYRLASSAADSQSGRGDVNAYREASNSASEQNHASPHLQ